MKEFIEHLLTNIVTKPEEVVVNESDENGAAIFNIKVAQEDMGIVIGKEGRTIKSLRSLARAKAIKDGVRVNIELADDFNQKHAGTFEQNASI